MTPEDWQERARALLVERGAESLKHPGGTLLAHLRRVTRLLRAWGASNDLQAAGYCHACYGTDGFPFPLMGLAERNLLADAIGECAEEAVYLYSSCDRRALYPRLRQAGPLLLRDRFNGQTLLVKALDASAFVELTAANELDLVLVNPEEACRWAGDFYGLLLGTRERLSKAALDAWSHAMTTLTESQRRAAHNDG